MRIALGLGAAWMAVLLLVPPEARAAADLTVLNRSRQPVVELYVSGADDDSWGDDRLHGSRIAPGRAYRVALRRGGDCTIDLRVIYVDGMIEEKRGIDACRTRQYAFDGSTGVRAQQQGGATSEGRHQVTVTNSSPRSISSLYLSDPSVDDWGEDRLGFGALPPGQRTQTSVAACATDIRVVFDNESAEERRSIDICQHPQLTIRPGWTTADDLGAGAPPAAGTDTPNSASEAPHASPPVDPSHRT